MKRCNCRTIFPRCTLYRGVSNAMLWAGCNTRCALFFYISDTIHLPLSFPAPIFHVLGLIFYARVRPQEIINLLKSSVRRQTDKQNADTFFVLAARLSSTKERKKKKDTRTGDHFSRNFTCIYATAASLTFFGRRVGIILLFLVPTVFYFFFMHATRSESGHVLAIACGAC